MKKRNSVAMRTRIASVAFVTLLAVPGLAEEASPDESKAGEPSVVPSPDAPPAPTSEPQASPPVEEVKAEESSRSRAPEAAPSDGQSEPRAASKAPKTEDKAENPLLPPDQARLLGKHPVKHDKTTFKAGSGLHWESDDGDFALTTRLRGQFREDVTYATSGGESELSQVFQIRRARLQFNGYAFGKHNKMGVEFAFSPRDLGIKNGVPHNSPLLSWTAEFDHLRDLSLLMGQYKIPYSRQRVVSSGDLQFVDRSIANEEFNHDRDIGFDVHSKDFLGLGGRLRYYAGVYMGEGRDFGDKNATSDFKLHYLGRIELLPFGDFLDYREADIERNETPKLSIGAAYSYHDDAERLRGVLGDRAEDGGTTDYHSFNVDYAFKWAGLSSTAEFHWRQGERNPGTNQVDDPASTTGKSPSPVTAARDGYGYHVQAGYLLPRTPVEVVARYSGVRGVGEADPGNLTSSTEGYTSLSRKDAVGGGVNYYFAGHPMKLQGDLFRVWDDGDASEAETRVRVQLQLSY